MSSVFSLFTRKSRRREAGWRIRILKQWTVNAIPASRSASVWEGERARGREGERCRQTTVRRSSLLGIPIPSFVLLASAAGGDLYVSIMSSRHQGTIDDVAISPISRSNDPVIFTLGF